MKVYYKKSGQAFMFWDTHSQEKIDFLVSVNIYFELIYFKTKSR